MKKEKTGSIPEGEEIPLNAKDKLRSLGFAYDSLEKDNHILKASIAILKDELSTLKSQPSIQWVKAHIIPLQKDPNTFKERFIVKMADGDVKKMFFDFQREVWINYRGNVVEWLDEQALPSSSTGELFKAIDQLAEWNKKYPAGGQYSVSQGRKLETELTTCIDSLLAAKNNFLSSSAIQWPSEEGMAEAATKYAKQNKLFSRTDNAFIAGAKWRAGRVEWWPDYEEIEQQLRGLGSYEECMAFKAAINWLQSLQSSN